MNFDKLNNWLTLIANIGVLLGIFIVIAELRQNTIATEAEVTWAHANAAQAIFLPSAFDPEIAQFTNEHYLLTTTQIDSYSQERSPELDRAMNYVSVVLNYYQSRYYTQTSDQQRQTLASHIRLRINLPIYGYWLNTRPDDWYEPEFRKFLTNIRNEREL